MVPEPIKDLDNLRPIDHAVIAKPHTPVYKMHRYFARRPWSVFHELVKHYSNQGSIILNPFCGGVEFFYQGATKEKELLVTNPVPIPFRVDILVSDGKSGKRDAVSFIYDAFRQWFPVIGQLGLLSPEDRESEALRARLFTGAACTFGERSALG